MENGHAILYVCNVYAALWNPSWIMTNIKSNPIHSIKQNLIIGISLKVANLKMNFKQMYCVHLFRYDTIQSAECNRVPVCLWWNSYKIFNYPHSHYIFIIFSFLEMEQPSKSQLFILSCDNCIQYSYSMSSSSSSSSQNKYFSIVSIFVWKLAFASQLEFGWIFSIMINIQMFKVSFQIPKKYKQKKNKNELNKKTVCLRTCCVQLWRLEVTDFVSLCHFHWTKLYMHEWILQTLYLCTLTLLCSG